MTQQSLTPHRTLIKGLWTEGTSRLPALGWCVPVPWAHRPPPRPSLTRAWQAVCVAYSTTLCSDETFLLSLCSLGRKAFLNRFTLICYKNSFSDPSSVFPRKHCSSGKVFCPNSFRGRSPSKLWLSLHSTFPGPSQLPPPAPRCHFFFR